MSARTFDPTGLFGDIEALTDIEEDESTTPGCFTTGQKQKEELTKEERHTKLKCEADQIYSAFNIRMSQYWHLSEARVSSSGYMDFPQKLDPKRLVVPKDTTPLNHLVLLKDAGYNLVKVR